MRDVPYTNSDTRTISAKVVSRRNRLLFADYTTTEIVSGGSVISLQNMDGDVDENGTHLAAYGVWNDMPYVFRYDHAPDYETSHAWVGITEISAATCPGIYRNVTFFANGNTLWKFDTAFTTVAIYPANYHSFAPVSTVAFYLFSTFSSAGKANRYATIRYYYFNGTWQYKEFPGVVNGVEDGPAKIDAVRLGDDHDFIYFNDSDGKRAMYVERKGDLWSEIKPVLPIDIVDDASKFVLTSAKAINSQVILTGLLSRAYSPDPIHVYMIGPEEFTIGRDMYIKKSVSTSGVLLLSGTTMYYAGNGEYSACDASGFLGNSTQEITSGINSFQMSETSNNPFSLNMDISSSIAPNIKSGDELDAFVLINDQEAKLGTFGVDMVTTTTGETGVAANMVLRSSAMKKLIQWESDAPYDLWSQTKLKTKPSDQSDVVKTAGTWTKDDTNDIYRLNTVNENGFLYATAKSSRNGIAKATFDRPATQVADFEAGVGLNYYEEVKEVDGAKDTYHNGIFVIQTATTFEIRLLRDNVWTVLATVAHSYSTSFKLMIQFNEGMVSGYYRSTTASWSQVLSTRLASFDYSPWVQNEEGRGAIYMRNITANSNNYPFLSTDMYVPIDDNSTFPSTGTVLVDDEQIVYSSKSPNNAFSGLTLAYGEDVYRQANTSGTWQNFSDIRSRNYIIQKFTTTTPMYIRGVEIYAKKVGYPEDGMVAMLCQGPIESLSPLGKTLSTATVYSEDISSDGEWVYFDFGDRILLNGTYWMVFTRGHDAAHPNSDNYYATPLYTNGTNNFYTFSDDTDAWTLVSGVAIPMVVYGQADEPGGSYGVYVNGGLVNGTDYTNCALHVQNETGKGTCYRIIGWKYQTGKPHILYLERNPSSAKKSSVLKIVPTLIASTRGANSTSATAHSTGLASLYFQPPYNGVSLMEYYSSDEDLCLEDMVRIIARKAGVLSVVGNKLTGTLMPVGGTGTIYRRNFVLTFPELIATDKVKVTVSDEDFWVIIDNVAGKVIFYVGGFVEELVPTGALLGRVKVSFYQNTMSVWCNGRFVISFATPQPNEDFFFVGFVNDTGDTVRPLEINIPEACMRVDNFILDEGTNGVALITNVIGEKRFFFQDTNQGNLRLFRDRTTVGGTDDPYISSTEYANIDNDNSISRFLVQGGECYEVINYDEIRANGNLFHLANMYEVYDLYDAKYFGALALDDTLMKRKAVQLTGTGDPRIEPNDRFYAKVTTGGSIPVVVDNVEYDYLINETDAEFSMVINGFEG